MEYSWTVASAVYVVATGGPTRRTQSAIKYLYELITGDNVPEHVLPEVAETLLTALVKERGLMYLDSALLPVQEDDNG